MSNTMWLVCTHHPNQVDAFLLADRSPRRDMSGRMSPYSSALHAPDAESIAANNARRAFEKFLRVHAHCGTGFDHFSIAYEKPKDHDVPLEKPLANAVHLTLVQGSAGAT